MNTDGGAAGRNVVLRLNWTLMMSKSVDICKCVDNVSTHACHCVCGRVHLWLYACFPSSVHGKGEQHMTTNSNELTWHVDLGLRLPFPVNGAWSPRRKSCVQDCDTESQSWPEISCAKEQNKPKTLKRIMRNTGAVWRGYQWPISGIRKNNYNNLLK